MKYSLNPHIFVFGKTIKKPKISISFLSYLLRGKQNILIDTVPDKAADAYIQDIESVLPVSQIDALILNHSEEDHSGALQAVLDRHPQLPIYCTPATKERLQPTYPEADFRVVQHGESLTLGDYTFQFIHTPGLHWPDNMVTWLASEKILFSNDLFGQYLAEESPVDAGYSKEAILKGTEPYFERVFAPASESDKAIIADIAAMPIQTAATGHGLILQSQWPAVRDFYVSHVIK